MESQVAYVLNARTYLYIIDFEGFFEYTFYNDLCKVTEVGKIAKNGHELHDALNLICKSHQLTVAHVHKLSDEEFRVFAQNADDYEWVNVL
jgi:nucleoside-triphosphatase THEP1